MVNITINKKKISVPEGTTILAAAKNHLYQFPEGAGSKKDGRAADFVPAQL